MTTIRVILADDHPVTRDGIRNLLQRASGIEVVGEADNGTEALRLIEELTPDVLLLDMEMPGLKGIDVARQLKAGSSPVRILALSAYDDKQYILELLASGASGYLVKEEAPEAIIEAVRGVAQGQQGWVSRRIAAQMMAWTREEPPKTNLTEREMGVLRLVAAGKTNQEIGLALGISDKTVEKHLEAIFAKLGVASRVEAAVWAVRAGWV
ncbi:MAG TPA: response regulator transcription factor [Anaerolineae bacterium]|nr:response regulator transcription factor [Anaerolineae bacterium]